MLLINTVHLILNFIKARWLVITCLLLVAIAALSLIPLPELPPTPGNDKTHHFIAYGALMFPAALRRPRYWIWIGVLFIAISGGIELLQPLANRHRELADLLANSLGVLFGTVVARALDPLCRKA